MNKQHNHHVGSSIVYKDNIMNSSSLSNSFHNMSNSSGIPPMTNSSSGGGGNPLVSSCKMIYNEKMFDLGQSLSDSRELRRSTSTGRRGEHSLSQSLDLSKSTRSEVISLISCLLVCLVVRLFVCLF
jgi:hypothetical protein